MQYLVPLGVLLTLFLLAIQIWYVRVKERQSTERQPGLPAYDMQSLFLGPEPSQTWF